MKNQIKEWAYLIALLVLTVAPMFLAFLLWVIYTQPEARTLHAAKIFVVISLMALIALKVTDRLKKYAVKF